MHRNMLSTGDEQREQSSLLPRNYVAEYTDMKMPVAENIKKRIPLIKSITMKSVKSEKCMENIYNRKLAPKRKPDIFKEYD